MDALLPILGVKPIYGRSFVEQDDREGSPEVVMLGYGYWQRRFGGDPGAVGRRIMVDGRAREVIGNDGQRSTACRRHRGWSE